MRRRFFFLAPFLLLGFLGLIAFGGFIVQQLWNWLVPPVFGWRELTFWQALGLLALCRILFGGSGWRGHVGQNVRRRAKERREQMTPEERERFREGIGAHLGFGQSTGESKEQ
jgi:hypothetical protein